MTPILEPAFAAFSAAVIVYVSLIALTRLAGLRSFSKLSSFDFAITVAFGSVLGGVVASGDPPIVPAVSGLASLYFLQMAVSVMRRQFAPVAGLVDNRPLLLMARREVIEENLRRAKLTRGDLLAKLREANVIQYDDIFAVVMETTGDVSVLHGNPAENSLDVALLEGVRGSERLGGLPGVEDGKEDG